ncbi:peptidoglycan DD-metalloendopeptidase family protein [Rathayibacter sp. KR2-224]|uniref:peptidoglycan DD-metalloendopeptidase family protein n=1 Tax=Rathayibacter sp. KR2-224 TaxID=3400913 RepID=UPI003C04C4BF
MTRDHRTRRSVRFWRALRVRDARIGLRALVAIAALALVGGIAAPAHADDYPSWQDVQNAKANQAAAQAEVTRIQGLIANLQTQVEQTQAASVKAGNELAEAQQKFDLADVRAQKLEEQASGLKKKADDATAQAGRLVAELYRSGGSNLTANIFLSGSKNSQDADKLLDHLGSASKLVENTSGIYQQAEQARNTAKATSDQANVARTDREQLRTDADAALKNAVAAAQAAQDALAAQQAQSVVLQAQLAALQDTTAKTVAGYQQGVAAREAAAAAAAQSGAGLPGGYVGPQGWAVPAYGPITDGFGPRVAPCSGCSSYHEGADIGAGCRATIYAAHDGTVTFTGPYGGYGNLVMVDNGGGISTRYGHIVNGGILVGAGQHVGAGEPIALVGSTGESTGCHLHFEVRINGSARDPVSFMAARGAPLG